MCYRNNTVGLLKLLGSMCYCPYVDQRMKIYRRSNLEYSYLITLYQKLISDEFNAKNMITPINFFIQPPLTCLFVFCENIKHQLDAPA